MADQGNWGPRTRALAVAVTMGLCLVAYGDDTTDPNNGFGPTDRPVFAFISVTDTFDLPNIDVIDDELRDNAANLGSQMIRLKIGTFRAGTSIRTTRFLSDGPVLFDTTFLPPDPETGGPANFDGNHVTMVGSFKTLAPDSTIHLMTPYTNLISASVQKAYFNASVFFDDLRAGLGTYPSTVEVALFIFDHQGDAGASINDIMQQVFHVDFVKPVVVVSPTPPLGSAEGVLFPHTPGEGQFGFDLDLDIEEGILDADVCLDVVIDVKPDSSNNTVNVGKNGVLPIAVMTTDDFDAVNELDPDTVTAVLIGTDGEVVNVVQPDRFDIEDVDGDGDDDVTYKFSVPALIDGSNAPLTKTTTSITFRGETFDGMCIQGTDKVTIVPPKK